MSLEAKRKTFRTWWTFITCLIYSVYSKQSHLKKISSRIPSDKPSMQNYQTLFALLLDKNISTVNLTNYFDINKLILL